MTIYFRRSEDEEVKYKIKELEIMANHFKQMYNALSNQEVQ